MIIRATKKTLQRWNAGEWQVRVHIHANLNPWGFCEGPLTTLGWNLPSSATRDRHFWVSKRGSSRVVLPVLVFTFMSVRSP